MGEWFLSTTEGGYLIFPIEVSGTGLTGDFWMCLDGHHVTSGHQPIGAAQLSINTFDYDLNKSLHCTGCRRPLIIWRYFLPLPRISWSSIHHTNNRRDSHACAWPSSFCWSPLLRARFGEMTLVVIFPMSREERDCSPMDIFVSNCWRLSGVNSSAMSLEVFVGMFDACNPSPNIPSWCWLPPRPAQPPGGHHRCHPWSFSQWQ